MKFRHLLYLAIIAIVPFGHIFAQPGCITTLFPADQATDVPLSFNLEWNVPATGDTPDMYHVYWGTDAGNLPALSSTNTTSVNISQPNRGQTFYWKVDTEANGVVTPACAIYSYTTVDIPVAPIIDCGAGNSVSESFDFEVNPGGFSGDLAAGPSTEYGKWNFASGPTSSQNTGPSGAYEGNQYIYYESSFNPIDASLVSPQVDLSLATGDVALEFYYFAYGNTIGSLSVGVGTNSTGPFTEIWNWDGQLQSDDTNPWELVGLDLSGYAGQQVYIQFLSKNNISGGFGDMALDFITVNGCEIFTPVNDDCITAIELSANGEPGMLIDENAGGSTESGMGASACNTNLGNDLFYTVESDEDGGALYIDVSSGISGKYSVILYDNNCGSATELACATAINTGDDVQLAYFVPNLTGNGSSSRLAPQTFIVRVYDENNAAENFTISSSGSALAALPVELISWNAKLQNNGVELEWRTAQELNTDGFEIEKSVDGRIWKKIAYKSAAGFSNSEQHYSFLDSETRNLQYYRLKIIDFNGEYEYSKLIKILRDDLNIKLYPNPVISDVNLDGAKFLSSELNISIYSLDGRMVKNMKVLNSSSISVNLDELNEGIYHMKIIDGQAIYGTRIVKK